MNRRPLHIGLLVLCAALLLVGGFFATFERKDVTEATVDHGEARYNPFFALQLALNRAGLPARSLTTLDPARLALKPGDTLLLGASAARVDSVDASRIVSWVRGGGHLLLSPGMASVARTPLFDALGLLDPRPAPFGCAKVHSPNAAATDYSVTCATRFRLKPVALASVDASMGNAQEGFLFARTRLGAGTVSLLASFAGVSGHSLKYAWEQQFAWRLLAPNRGKGTIYLVYALDGASFLTFLAIKGWPALVALALLLAAWMAMRSARLGPLMPAPSPHRRALLEHVHAAGEFLYRRDAGRTLHRLASDTVLARLRRRDPACAMLNGETLYARVAERSALDVAQIAQAFQSPANAQAFRTSLITLARLRSRP
ncbi:MAG: DUF4350 domain-containing protein [Rhodanobacter sp.]